MPRQPTSPFTPPERDLIRLELMPRFGQEPDLANGLFLRTWRAGPQKGQPKIPKAIQTMLDRGLVKIGTNPMGRAAAFFTEAGIEALRRLLQGAGRWIRCGTGICGESLGWMIHLLTESEAGELSPTCPQSL